MKILGSWPACGMWYSRNVSAALCYCWALISFISRKLNFASPLPPLCFMAKEVNLAKAECYTSRPNLRKSLCRLLWQKETRRNHLFSLRVCISSSQGCLLCLMPAFIEERNRPCKLCWFTPFLLLKVFQETIVRLVLRFGWVHSRGSPLSSGFLPGGGRRPPEQQATHGDTALILLVVLQFKRQKWLQLKNVL